MLEEIHQSLRKQVHKEIKGYDSILETVRNNITTPDELFEYSEKFDPKNGFEATLQYKIKIIYRLLTLIVQRIEENEEN